MALEKQIRIKVQEKALIIRDSISYNIQDKVNYSVWDTIRDKVSNNVWNNIRINIANNARFSLKELQ
jgi:hypothetical protein